MRAAEPIRQLAATPLPSSNSRADGAHVALVDRSGQHTPPPPEAAAWLASGNTPAPCARFRNALVPPLMQRLLFCLSCALLLVGLSSSRLQAQLINADKAAAQALLEEARKLVDQRHYATACVKLEESQALDPTPGTLLRLADCYEKTGRTATAWSTFRETAAAARRASEPERERTARKRARELQRRLSYLTVVTWKGQDIAVARDGNPLDSALVGTPLPVDPGAHEIVASAPGKRSWRTRVTVKSRSDRVTVSVPILAEVPGAAAQGTLEPPLRAATDTRTDRDYAMPEVGGGGVQRAFALAAAALGVAGIATGTVFGLKAGSTMNEAKAQCAAPGYQYPSCGDSSVRLSEEAVQSGQISTISFVAGGAGLAAFALLWLTAPSPSAASMSLALRPLALDLHGSF